MPRETIHISAPAAYVFAWLDDPRRHVVPPPWCTARLEWRDPLPHRVGHRYFIRVGSSVPWWSPPLKINTTNLFTCTEYEPPHRLAFCINSSFGAGGSITTDRWRLVEDPSGTLVTAEYQSEWVDHRVSRLKHDIESALGLPSAPATYKPEVWADPRPLPRRDGIGDGAAALAIGLSWVSAATMPALLGSPAREAVPIVALATVAAGSGLVLLVRRRMRARRADTAENALGSVERQAVVLPLLGVFLGWLFVFVAVSQARLWLRAPPDTWTSAWVATTASAALLGMASLVSHASKPPMMPR